MLLSIVIVMFDLSPLWISLKTAFTATIITFFLGIAAARWMFTYRGKARGLIDGLLTLPLVLPPTVVGFCLLLFCGLHGPLRYLLPEGETLLFSEVAAIMAATVVAFPLMYKTALGAFEQIDVNLLHAARTLGAPEWSIFWRVILPLAYPGVAAGTILAFARALGEFGATLMVAGNIPGKTQTMPIAIFFAAEGGQMVQASIWVMIIVAISLFVIAIVNYWSYKRLRVDNKNLKVQSKSWTINLEFLRDLYFEIEKFFLRIHVSKTVNDRVGSRPLPLLQANIRKQLQRFTLDVSFEANGYPLGFLGPSGSGKSMTLRCIAGLATPPEGRIVLNGRTLFDSQARINLPTHLRRIGFVFQNYALFPHMTVAQNIAFGLRYKQLNGVFLSKIKRNQCVAEKIALAHLHGMENYYPHQLSGGQQQRVALARALAIEPEALLLDEPFSALDTYLRSKIGKQLVEVLSTYQGVTLFVTHDLEEAYRVCQRLLVVSEGKTIACAPRVDIFERPETLTTAKLTGCKNFSRIQIISPQEVRALNWDCTLSVIEPFLDLHSHVGIRAHHLVFTKDRDKQNTFPAWLSQISEAPHQVTLFLKLNSPTSDSSDYDLQAEVSREKWALIKDKNFPWYVHLDPLRLLSLSS
jgi:molybdate ABC transporter permease protein